MIKLKEIVQAIRPRIVLRFWEGAGELLKIAKIHDKWWDSVKGWTNWLPQQIDVMKAPIELVNMLAYERDIERFPGEPQELYRKRVKYAFVNSRDAGTVAGFFRIWKRLGLGKLEQNERIKGQDWDIVELSVDDEIFSKYQHLFDLIIRKYGRTCRRYRITTKTIQPLGLRSFGVGFSTTNTLAKAKGTA
jgi:hypothetical protein